MTADSVPHPTDAETSLVDRFFASAFCHKLPFWLGGATVLLLAIAFLSYRADLGPLRNILLLVLAAGFCFCSMCVFLDTGSESRARLVSLAQLLIGTSLISAGLLAFLPGPELTWDQRVRGTAPELTETERNPRLNEYVRNANKGVINYTGGVAERLVSDGLRQAILKRDGHRCIICSAKRKEFEVDHSRALMNGGSNEPENLASLCLDCHNEKTSMDKSLRRNREKMQKRKTQKNK